jgi:hypothetical protein
MIYDWENARAMADRFGITKSGAVASELDPRDLAGLSEGSPGLSDNCNEVAFVSAGES